MPALKFADHLQRSISLFLFGTTLFAGYMTAHTIRQPRQAIAAAVDDQAIKREVYFTSDLPKLSFFRVFAIFSIFHYYIIRIALIYPLI